MVKTIQKLKAGLAAVIKNDQRTNVAAKKIYCANQTLYIDSDEEQVGMRATKNNLFYQFLNDETEQVESIQK